MPLFDPQTQRPTPESEALFREMRARFVEHILPLLVEHITPQSPEDALATLYLARGYIDVLFDRAWVTRGVRLERNPDELF